MTEQFCLCGCGTKMRLAAGQIAYYIRGHRKEAKRRMKPLIEAEYHRKRPWWFWLYLDLRRFKRWALRQTL